MGGAFAEWLGGEGGAGGAWADLEYQTRERGEVSEGKEKGIGGEELGVGSGASEIGRVGEDGDGFSGQARVGMSREEVGGGEGE